MLAPLKCDPPGKWVHDKPLHPAVLPAAIATAGSDVLRKLFKDEEEKSPVARLCFRVTFAELDLSTRLWLEASRFPCCEDRRAAMCLERGHSVTTCCN